MPGTAHVLVDDSVVARLERGDDEIRIVERSDFGAGLWLLLVESARLADGYGYAQELVTWDTGGSVPAHLKPWREL